MPKAARLIAHVLTTLTVLSVTASSVRVVSDARRRLRQSSAATESKIRARQVSTVAVQAAEQLINCVLREWRATVMLTVRPVFAFLTRQPIRKTTRTHLVPVSPVQTRGKMDRHRLRWQSLWQVHTRHRSITRPAWSRVALCAQPAASGLADPAGAWHPYGQPS